MLSSLLIYIGCEVFYIYVICSMFYDCVPTLKIFVFFLFEHGIISYNGSFVWYFLLLPNFANKGEWHVCCDVLVCIECLRPLNL